MYGPLSYISCLALTIIGNRLMLSSHVKRKGFFHL